MRFESRLLRGRLLRRYKRFLADVELEGGDRVTAHCANPGSMKTCLREGARVWLTETTNPTRKLRYTWQLVELDGARIFVNPARANDLVTEALKRGRLPELAGYDVLRREVRISERSRIDFVLFGRHTCYVEVKNVTLTLGAGRSAFPDSVTARGVRHLEELSLLREKGHRAVMLFCAARSDARSVEPAREIDPAYARALERAASLGVELLAYRCRLSEGDEPLAVELAERVPVRL